MRIHGQFKTMAPDDGKGGGETDAAADAAAAAAAEAEKVAADDAENNSFDVSKDFWSDKDEDEGKKPAAATDAAPAAGPTEEEQFDEHVASMDFGEFGLDQEGLQTLFDNRDVSGLQDGINGMMRNVYGQVLKDAGKLMQSQKKAILAEAQGLMKNHTDANADRSALEAALPFTKEAAIQPVAESIMAKAKERGESTEKAIETTRAFFKAMSTVGAKDLGIQQTDANDPGSSGFNAENQTGSEPEDWAKFLSN